MEGRELIKDAIADAKSLREAAVESAKKELVENLAPAVRKLLDEQIKGALHERDRTGPKEWDKSPEGGTRQQKKDYGDLATNEELTLEDAINEFFPGAEGEVKENNMSDVNEKASCDDDKKSVKEAASSGKASEVSEEIEISEAELKKVYEAALQTEVNVKKGFGDITGFVELGGKTPGNEKTAADPQPGKGGTKMFSDETPPNKKTWIPEARELHGMLQRGLSENKALRESLRKAATMIETLGRKLHEVNLFNAKVLHVNKILNSGARLTREQKTFVMESIDKARSISEVKMVFETIVGSIRTSAAINESRNPRIPKGNASRARTSGTPDQRVLSESVDKGTQQGGAYSRIRELAGLLK